MTFPSRCGCIRTDCWHPVDGCEEPPSHRGGVCSTCQHHTPPPKCPNCGQPMPEEKS